MLMTPDEAVIGKLNVDKNRKVAMQYQIMVFRRCWYLRKMNWWIGSSARYPDWR